MKLREQCRILHKEKLTGQLYC